MYQNKHLSIILLMAGSSSRMSGVLPKQFAPLGGIELFRHSLAFFLSQTIVDEICLVVPKEYKALARQLCENDIDERVHFVVGGESRPDSTLSGLQSLRYRDIVMIHDAARPFITKAIFQDNLDKVLEYGAVDTVIAATDTLVYAPNKSTIEEIPKRSHYYQGQTPQTFLFDVIMSSYQKVKERKIATDDCSIVLQAGFPISLAKGEATNIKITHPTDLSFAHFLLQKRVIDSDITWSLKNKIIALVGGSGAIGKTLKDELCQKGAKVLILSKSSKSYPIDLTCSTSIKETFAKIYKKYGEIDALINAAGYLEKGALSTLTTDAIMQMLHTNLSGVILSCKEAQIKKGGHILNIASSSYLFGREQCSIYSSAKAALVNFTQALAKERSDLFINIAIPSRTETPMRQKNFGRESQETLLDSRQVAKSILSLLQSRQSGVALSISKYFS